MFKKLWNKLRLLLHKVSASGRKSHLCGKFYIVYPEGYHTVNMDYRTAKDYQNIFGGEIHHVEGLM